MLQEIYYFLVCLYHFFDFCLISVCVVVEPNSFPVIISQHLVELFFTLLIQIHHVKMDFLKYLFLGHLHFLNTVLSLYLILGKSHVYSCFWVKTTEKCFVWLCGYFLIGTFCFIKAFLRSISYFSLVFIMIFYRLFEQILSDFDVC